MSIEVLVELVDEADSASLGLEAGHVNAFETVRPNHYFVAPRAKAVLCVVVRQQRPFEPGLVIVA